MITQDTSAFKPTKEELYNWLDKQLLVSIATNGNDGFPNVATVAFSQTNELEFVIITDGNSRKARNIANSDKVALVVTNSDSRYTVQIEGIAKQLSWDDFEKYSDYHYRKLPFSLPFKDIKGQTPFVIKPVNIRFTDASVKPWELTEVQR